MGGAHARPDTPPHGDSYYRRPGSGLGGAKPREMPRRGVSNSYGPIPHTVQRGSTEAEIDRRRLVNQKGIAAARAALEAAVSKQL